MPKTVVTNGTIHLPDGIEASVISVGLPIEASITTLPLAFQVDAAMGQGRTKSLNKVWLRVYESVAVLAGIYGGKSMNTSNGRQRYSAIRPDRRPA